VEKIPSRRFIKKAEETGNEAEVPMAQNLGLVELLKRLAKEIQEDHLAAFAGISRTKVSSLSSHFSCFCSPC
jgi:hypothetical protein